MPFLVLAAALLEGLSLTLVQGYLPLYVRRALGETHFLTIGAVVAVPALGTFIASNFWGGLSDVSGRLKPFILVGLVGYVAALTGYPLFRHGYGILLWAGMASLLYGTLAPSLKTYVTLAQPTRREHALAYLLMSQSIGWFLGSVGGSRLLERGIASGFRFALWACAALLAAHAVLVALKLRDWRREPAPIRRTRGWLEGVVQDLASLYENPRLLSVCVLIFFLVAGNYITWGFFAVFFVEHLHASVGTLGLALGISSLLGILLMPFVGPLVRRFGGHRILAVGTTLYIVMYLGMALTRNPLAAAALFAMPLYGMVNVSASTLASQYSTGAQRGGGLGILNGTYALATIVGPLIGGSLADRSGLGAIPWTSLGFAFLASAIAWWSVAAKAATARAVGSEAHGTRPADRSEASGRNAD
ncbi:MAG: MFS transporter [Candidatus Eisenbacteria bacterium]|uniref:MFS transporter n=1 Tax=Eiseniibacteriota bacterium TaxID=2212470 RepID=A0A538SVU4_UNCEI|nr:MAG: MFS transporter [Candidatus Eisenbacteria bacterium]